MRVEERAIRLAEPTALLGYPRRGLDDPNTSEILLDRREVLPNSLTNTEVRLVRIPLELDRGDHDHRQHEKRDQGELPRQRQQHHQRDRQQDSRRHELEQAPLHELRHRLDVGGHARHQHAGFVLIEEAERLPLNMSEKPEA